MNTAVPEGAWATTLVKPKRSRVRLDSVFDTRREAARQYRRALEGEIKIEDMSRLVNALAILSRMIETGEFESRLAKLEGLSE